MRIRGIRTISRPNVWYHHPALVMRLDLEDLVDTDNTQIDGFVERLLALLLGLGSHTCSPGRVGGFVERLELGTYIAHIVEHVALELSEPTGIGPSPARSSKRAWHAALSGGVSRSLPAPKPSSERSRFDKAIATGRAHASRRVWRSIASSGTNTASRVISTT